MDIKKVIKEIFKRMKIIDENYGTFKPLLICLGLAVYLGIIFTSFFPHNFFIGLIITIFMIALYNIFYFRFAYNYALKKQRRKNENT